MSKNISGPHYIRLYHADNTCSSDGELQPIEVMVRSSHIVDLLERGEAVADAKGMLYRPVFDYQVAKALKLLSERPKGPDGFVYADIIKALVGCIDNGTVEDCNERENQLGFFFLQLCLTGGIPHR